MSVARTQPPSGKKRILVVDDHPVYRDGLKHFIEREHDLVCSAVASNMAEAIQACRRERPDIVVLDLRLRQEDSTELIPKLRAEFKDLPTLVVSNLAEDLHAERVLKAGARGYIMKECPTEQIIEAIRKVLSGDLYLSPRMASVVLHKVLVPGKSGKPTGLEVLTPRERDVFRLLGSGVKSRDIATRLGVSFKTVAAHKDNIKRKLNLASTTAVIHCATRWVEHGII